MPVNWNIEKKKKKKKKYWKQNWNNFKGNCKMIII